MEARPLTGAAGPTPHARRPPPPRVRWGPPPRPGPASRIARRSCRPRRRGSSSEREIHLEVGSDADVGLDLDAAAVLGDHDTVADREAETGPAPLRLRGVERLQDPWQGFPSDPRARVEGPQ